MSASLRIGEHIRHNVVGYIALFCFAIGGVASALPGRNTVDSGDIKPGNVRRGDLAPNSVDSTKVVNNSLVGADVDEATLAPGGDLSGTLADAQVNEGQVIVGGDLSGTVANAQVADSAVGDAEIANVARTFAVTPDQLGPATLTGAGRPAAGLASGFAPALFFDPTANEVIDIAFSVPQDRVGGSAITAKVFFTAATNSGSVVWDTHAEQYAEGDTTSGGILVGPTITTPVPGTVNEVDSFSFNVAGSTGFQNGAPADLRITRDAINAADTMAGDAALLMVEFTYQAVR